MAYFKVNYSSRVGPTFSREVPTFPRGVRGGGGGGGERGSKC